MDNESDFGITVTYNLSWNNHINKIVNKANKLSGILKRSCPLLTDSAIRRTLYLSHVKSQLCYASEVWSPVLSIDKINLERVQRRATSWILRIKKGDMSYKERLLSLNLLPLVYNREIKDLTYFYKLLHGFNNLNVLDFVSFVNHTRTHHCKNPSLVLKVPRCKKSTFQSSFFNRIVPLWNCICTLASPGDFRSIVSFKTFLSRIYLDLLTFTFDVNMTCSWSLCRSCSCHRGQLENYVST